MLVTLALGQPTLAGTPIKVAPLLLLPTLIIVSAGCQGEPPHTNTSVQDRIKAVQDNPKIPDSTKQIVIGMLKKKAAQAPVK
jgi:hypothetical protein